MVTALTLVALAVGTAAFAVYSASGVEQDATRRRQPHRRATRVVAEPAGRVRSAGRLAALIVVLGVMAAVTLAGAALVVTLIVDRALG